MTEQWSTHQNSSQQADPRVAPACRLNGHDSLTIELIEANNAT